MTTVFPQENFPGGPVVKTLSFHCKRHAFFLVGERRFNMVSAAQIEKKYLNLTWVTATLSLHRIMVWLEKRVLSRPKKISPLTLHHSDPRQSHSAVSNSLRPHGLCSAWNSPSQNNGIPFWVTLTKGHPK